MLLPRNAWILSALLATAAIAGCLDGPAAQQDGAGDPLVAELTPTQLRLGAIPVPREPEELPYTNDDWFLISGPRHPDGHVRAFEWRLPAGAVQENERSPIPFTYVELVTGAASYAPGQDWVLHGLLENEGEAHIMFSLFGATAESENLTEAGGTETATPTAGGMAMLVSWPGLSDGDSLHLILVAYGAPSDHATFSLRTLVSGEAARPVAAPDLDAVIESEPSAPFALLPRHDSTGSHDALYREVLANDERRRIATENVVHEHESAAGRQEADAVRQRITTTARDGPGWSLAYVRHDAGAETTYWTLDLATQGVTGRANGIAGDDPGGVTEAATVRLIGSPLALLMADGDGASHARLTLDRGSADVGLVTHLQHHQLPQPLEELIGVPSATMDGISTGETGGLPWIGPLPPP